MLLGTGGSAHGRGSFPSPTCKQAKFLLSNSGMTVPAGSVPPSLAMYRSGVKKFLQCRILGTYGA